MTDSELNELRKLSEEVEPFIQVIKANYKEQIEIAENAHLDYSEDVVEKAEEWLEKSMKTLVLNNKLLATINAGIQENIIRLTAQLELAEKGTK
jgi:hypothetical protein